MKGINGLTRHMYGSQLSLGLQIPLQQKVVKSRNSSNFRQRATLYRKYADKLLVNHDLSRSLVSFQANKSAPFYRWLKYKEAFSSELVQYFLDTFKTGSYSLARVLDPFAGVGTTLTTAGKAGCCATGIELMPVGAAAIHARLLADTVSLKSFAYHLGRLSDFPLESPKFNTYCFPHLGITERAFLVRTERALSAYQAFLEGIQREDVRTLFRFACLAILEEVSYTRKDGQYLRWDSRSGRLLKSNFNKGKVYEFRPSIIRKLKIILEDLKRGSGHTAPSNVELIEGSCLTELYGLPEASFTLVITSPPYCNRYDYTRTYALELAFLGYTEDSIRKLRQQLLTCTVENKSKREQLAEEYRIKGVKDRYNAAVRSFMCEEALQEVLSLLYDAEKRGELNNSNIPAMVENYFFEMNLVIHELARVLSPGGHIAMVNDNVQYHGEEIPVDLILSNLAARAGLDVEHIWVLPRGKGNSSQQMGTHGRNELRKCVYVWSKPASCSHGQRNK